MRSLKDAGMLLLLLGAALTVRVSESPTAANVPGDRSPRVAAAVAAPSRDPVAARAPRPAAVPTASAVEATPAAPSGDDACRAVEAADRRPTACAEPRTAC